MTFEKSFARLAGLVEKRYSSMAIDGNAVPFALRTAGGSAHLFGGDEPAFTVVMNDQQGVAALSTLDQNAIVAAYLAGSIDLEGDIMRVLALRELFSDRLPLRS